MYIVAIFEKKTTLLFHPKFLLSLSGESSAMRFKTVRVWVIFVLRVCVVCMLVTCVFRVWVACVFECFFFLFCFFFSSSVS